MKLLFYTWYLTYICFAYGERTLIKYNSIEDLSHQLNEKTLYFDEKESLNLNVVSAKEAPQVGWMSSKTFFAGEHGGTHLDAPHHFNKNGWKVADIPICHLILQGVLIDVQDKAKNKPNFKLSPVDVREWESVNGEIPPSSVVLINYGWAHLYPDKASFSVSATPPYNFPGISKETAEYLISKKIYSVGTDMASVNPSHDKTFDTHKTFAQSNIYILENVNLKDTKLPSRGFDLIMLPLKIANGTGAPVRIVALY